MTVELIIVWIIVFAVLMSIYRGFKVFFDIFSWLWFIFLSFNIAVHLCEINGVTLPQSPLTKIPSKFTEIFNDKLSEPFKGNIEKICESSDYSPTVKAYCINIVNSVKNTLNVEKSIPNIKNFVISELEKTCNGDIECLSKFNYFKAQSIDQNKNTMGLKHEKYKSQHTNPNMKDNTFKIQ